MIYKNLLETIGNTPLIRINELARENNVKANILGKCEFFNPLGSIKDRIALAMIEKGEKDGYINKDTTIIEPTSGNTGIGLAFVCAARGYKIILTMPESMSIERQKMLKHLGAKVVLTSSSSGMVGAIEKSVELHSEIENSFIPKQFDNPANPEIHKKTTAEEIWKDTDGKVDVLIAGIGTGGTITGIGELLKERNPSVEIVAVEPKDSPVLSGGQPSPHQIQGIGAGFIPRILNTKIIDKIICISNEEAFLTAKQVAQSDGLPVGISSGAALSASIKIGQQDKYAEKNIVVMLPSFAERYLSTRLFD